MSRVFCVSLQWQGYGSYMKVRGKFCCLSLPLFLVNQAHYMASVCTSRAIRDPKPLDATVCLFLLCVTLWQFHSTGVDYARGTSFGELGLWGYRKLIP
jgi:hypothetical protein